jgi:hypothetical protein
LRHVGVPRTLSAKHGCTLWSVIAALRVLRPEKRDANRQKNGAFKSIEDLRELVDERLLRIDGEAKPHKATAPRLRAHLRCHHFSQLPAMLGEMVC